MCIVNDFQALYNKELDKLDLIVNGYNFEVIMQDLPIHDGTCQLTSTFKEDELKIIITRNDISCSYASYSLLYEILYLMLTKTDISTIKSEYMRDTIIPQLTLGIFNFLNTNFFKLEHQQSINFNVPSLEVNSDVLNIGGFMYKIIYADSDIINKFNGEKCYGITYNMEQEIHLSTAPAKTFVSVTLIHEILHAIIHTRGSINMEVDEEEALVEYLSHELNVFLKCNQLVIRK